MFESSSDPAVVMRRRAGRVAFGIALVVGAIAIVLHLTAAGPWRLLGDDGACHDTAWWFAATWAGALAIGLVTRLVARLRPPSAHADGLLRASLVWPAIGIALVLPLTLHLVWFLLATGGVDGFDDWARLTLIAAGLAHVVFAGLAALRASRLARGQRPVSVLAIYGWSVAAAAVPMVVPVFFVAVTGLPIMPLLYGMTHVADRERRVVGLPPAWLRRAGHATRGVA